MRVAIWDVSNTAAPLRQATVPTASMVIGDWSFVDVPDFTLVGGQTYRIAAETETATVAWGTFDKATSLASVRDGHVFADPTGGFAFPAIPDSLRLLAANAEIVPIPEPSSFVLLILGLAGIWFARRRV
jgi:hypothetical protein